MSSSFSNDTALHYRLDEIEMRLEKLEKTESAGSSHAIPAAAVIETKRVSSAAGSDPEFRGWRDAKPNETQQRLTAELHGKCIPHTFIRVGPDYYERSLEERRNILGATTIHQLCKSMVMENTKAPACAQRFFLVVIQYASAIQAELLKKHVLSIETSDGKRLSRSQCNMRLASEEDSFRLTGYAHNGVSPVGLRKELPLIVASEIAELQFMWLGGGEPDLKLGMSVPQFLAGYKATVVSCSNLRRTVEEN